VLEARNLRTTPQRLLELAKDPARPVRCYVAMHRSTPVEALLLLLQDDEAMVVWLVKVHGAAALDTYSKRTGLNPYTK